MAYSDSYKYQMYLTYNCNQEMLRFPLLPQSVAVDCGNNLESVNIVGLGEIVRKKDRPAVRIALDVVLPARGFPGQKVKKIQHPETLKNRILRWKEKDKPCRFLITETGINLLCRIADFKYEERGGDKGSIYISLTLIEYRAVKVRQVELDEEGRIVEIAPELRVVPGNIQDVPATYKTRQGDTFVLISKRFFGTADKWKEIYKLNPKVSHPSLLRAGMIIKLKKAG